MPGSRPADLTPVTLTSVGRRSLATRRALGWEREDPLGATAEVEETGRREARVNGSLSPKESRTLAPRDH